MLLIVDDSALFRLMVRGAIEAKFDIEIVEIDTVKGMQEFLYANPLGEVSLIILDLNLPDGNGLAAFSQVIDRNRGRQIPFIIVSKGVNRAIVPLAKKCGVGDILAKPINPDQLVQTILQLYPDVFVPHEKGNKILEDYSGVIRKEMVKAQKGSYPLGLFLVEIKEEEKTKVNVERGRHYQFSGKHPANLRMRLKSGELNLVFPITDKKCLVLLPFVGKDDREETKVIFLEILEKSGLLVTDEEVAVAALAYPEQGGQVGELIQNLKQGLEDERVRLKW